jgi:isopenicillin N synthase-like dioxygenase
MPGAAQSAQDGATPGGSESDTIPVISLAAPDRTLLANACESWGLFHISHHGVAPEVISGLRNASRGFFSAPAPVREAVMRTRTNPWGYFDRELTKNVRDWKEIFDVGPSYGTSVPQWPDSMPMFRATLSAYTDAVHVLALRVLRLIIEALDQPATDILAAFDAHTSFLRLNHYPVCATPAAADSPTVPERGNLGIGHHTDAGALTILDQADIPGLQVLHEGRWRDVPVLPECFTVNIGDVVQVWSNDRFPAPLHRVLANGREERYSTAYFLNPPADFHYLPLLSPESSHLARYNPVNWRYFREQRAAGDYANYGEEIQISHFRRTHTG